MARRAPPHGFRRASGLGDDAAARASPFLPLLCLALLAAGAAHWACRAPEAGARRDDEIIRRAFENQRSNLWVESRGVVERVLDDDRHGSPHQRFVLRLGNGHTVLVSHNLDLAARVEVRRGAEVGFRGEYEWNPRGGVIHWTHHDPQGRLAGGWLEVDGRRFR